ncbi:MAG: oxidoreductase [Proteobacteria bacterium SG_bin5]|nr:GpE family phage tail protein [Sphingomonas sp.]OQW42077.1 MAG: oxidoreductase [Proteobacteria bacterium SG_bin5]
MADIAAVFHWPLATMEAMALDELFAWRARAVDRWNRMNGANG